MIDTRTLQALLAAARAARRHAHAPYSKFKVGAAVLMADRQHGGNSRLGNLKIFTGANVENASYGLTICAERAAIAAAVTAGGHRLRAVLIVTDGAAPPCGACRQVLAEFAGPQCPIYLAAPTGRRPPQCLMLGDLLPHAFKLEHTNGN